MGSVQRRLDRGTRLGVEVLRRSGDELRQARLAAGLSQARLGAAARVSKAEVSRIERAAAPYVSVPALARLFAIVGLRLSVKAYPDGPPLRDVGQARLLGRLRDELHPALRFRTEVLLRATEGDMRAWDGEIGGSNETCKVEAETRLHDIQAVERRTALKMADDQVSVVILLVAESRGNAAVLREFRELLRPRFPFDTRQVLRALRRGEVPSASGICVL